MEPNNKKIFQLRVYRKFDSDINAYRLVMILDEGEIIKETPKNYIADWGRLSERIRKEYIDRFTTCALTEYLVFLDEDKIQENKDRMLAHCLEMARVKAVKAQEEYEEFIKFVEEQGELEWKNIGQN